MDEILKKIDQIKSRTGVNYATAKDALDKCGGDVLDAIIYLENQYDPSERKASGQKHELWHGLQEIVQKGRETKIRVLKDGKQVAEVPAAAGVLGLVGALAVPGDSAQLPFSHIYQNGFRCGLGNFDRCFFKFCRSW
jgi:hypothetical protein